LTTTAFNISKTYCLAIGLGYLIGIGRMIHENLFDFLSRLNCHAKPYQQKEKEALILTRFEGKKSHNWIYIEKDTITTVDSISQIQKAAGFDCRQYDRPDLSYHPRPSFHIILYNTCHNHFLML
jgi:hypothetical protein